MEQVGVKFYNWYNRLVTTVGGILFIATAAVWVLPTLATYRTSLGLSIITGTIGLVQLIYGTLFYPSRARANPPMAALLATMITILSIINIIHNTGQFHSWFIIAWVVFALFSGMFGLYSAITYGFLITIYFVMIATGPEAGYSASFDPIALASVIGTYIICAISYNIWKHFYINQESKKIQQLSGALNSSQAQATILIESIVDGIIVTDAESKITLLNPAAAKMTGWALNDAMGIDSKLVIKLQLENGKELEDGEDPFEQLSTTLKPATTLMRLISKSNAFIIVSLSVSPIMKSDGKTMAGSVAVIRDVSDARAEENRRADFISTASHEMRTPVAAIEGYLQLALNEKVAKVDAKARDFLTKALVSSHHLGQLFQDLLTSAKAEDGRLVSHPVVVEVGDLLQKLTNDLRFVAEKKGLLLDFRIGTSTQDASSAAGGGKTIKPLYYAYIDPGRLQEVITNLFDNAVKFTAEGKIIVALTGNDEVVQFFIKDTGQGIPAEDIPHLFQKFYRVDNSSTRTIGGTGLGLFISKRIIETYKGRIWVESEKGKGSTFYINIPRLSSQKATEMLRAEQQQVV